MGDGESLVTRPPRCENFKEVEDIDDPIACYVFRHAGLTPGAEYREEVQDVSSLVAGSIGMAL